MKELYWCDCCSNKKLDMETNKLYDSFFNCNTQNNYVRHLSTAKHLETIKNIEKDSENILCKHCNINYTKEGYEVHKKRNAKLWMFKKGGALKKQKCNNFYIGSHRFESLDEQMAFSNKPKQKRTAVGKFSPVTGVVRTKNKKPQDEHVEEEFISSEEEEEEEEAWSTKGDIIPSTDAEVDYTERPQFDEFCDTCGYGVNYTYPIKIIDKWGIKTCACPDSDDTDSD